jgi:DNA repair protein RadC
MAHMLLIRDGEQLRAASAQEVLDRAAVLQAQRFRPGTAVLENPERTRQYLPHQIAALPYEVFGLLLLDTRHRLIRSDIHNHPSGVAEPSQADELITRRLKETLSLLDVRVLDHLIIADAAEYSFAETGLL